MYIFNNLMSICVSKYLSLHLSKHTFIYILSVGLMNFLFIFGTSIWLGDCSLTRTQLNQDNRNSNKQQCR